MNAIFPFTRTAFKCLCLVVLFLFGGVSVEHNTISLGTTSCQAITVNRLPAKGKVERKANRFFKRLFKVKWNKGGSPDYSYLYNLLILFLVILFVGSVVLGIWAINLLIAGKFLGGIAVLLASLGGIFLSIRHLGQIFTWF